MRAAPPLFAVALAALAGCSASGASSGPTKLAPVATLSAGTAGEGAEAVTVPSESSDDPPTEATEADDTSPDRPVVTDNRVYLLGDSITESISSRYSGAICDVLGPLGWDVTVDAVQSRNTGQAVQSLRAHRTGVGQVLVVLIGHNDGRDPETYRTQIERLISTVPDTKRILLLTNYEFERGRDRMNDVLREIAATDGDQGPDDRLELVEWNEELQGVDGAIQSDGLHLTSIGQEALAHTIASALGPAPSELGGSTKRICTTLRSPRSTSSSGSGSGSGSGTKHTTTTASGTASSAPPSSGPSETGGTNTTAAGSGPSSSDAPPSSGGGGGGGGGGGNGGGGGGGSTSAPPTSTKTQPPGSAAPPADGSATSAP
jgi:lysophospholipase L1-like esterase